MIDMLACIGLVVLLLRRKQVAEVLATASSILQTIREILWVITVDRFPWIETISAALTNGGQALTAWQDTLAAAVTPALAWLWSLCLVLTFIVGFTPLEITNPYLHSLVHSGVWLLVFFAARHFGWDYRWPRRLWVGSIVVGSISAVLALWPLGLPAILYEAGFFVPVRTWQTTRVYFRRGQEIVADQHHALHRADHRRVLIRPVTPLFAWVEPLGYVRYQNPERPAGAGWEEVHLNAANLQPDTAEQEQGQQKRIEECYQQMYRRDEQLAQQGQRPVLVLPPISQRGANTLGFRLQNSVWASRSCCPGPGQCKSSGLLATWKKVQLTKKYDLILKASPCVGNSCQSIYLVLSGIEGPGTYSLGEYSPATRTINGSFLRLSNATSIYLSKPALRVTISRFDTVAGVAAGTFEGAVTSRAADAPTLRLQHGRFDVHLDAPPNH